MKKRRYSGDDHHLWPFTLSKSSYRSIGIVIDSGAREGECGDCHVRFSAFGWTLICELPQIISDYRVRHVAKYWDADTIAKLGRDWYEERFDCVYGFSFNECSLYIYHGPQTHDSITTKSKCYFLPWLHTRHIRHSFFDTQGKHFWTDRGKDRNSWEARHAVKDAVPKVKFDIEDEDGAKVTATTHIEEREWRHGTGWFSWLSLFRKPQVIRSLDIEFSAETGPEKGSWKGGTIGTSIEMLPGELHESAFKRYCEQEHRSKYRLYKVRFLGRTPPETQRKQQP